MGISGGRLRAAAAGALFMALPAAPAQAQACWSQALVEAAQVKEYDIMLMVATLRCQVTGREFSGRYNQFVATHRSALRGVGDEILRALNASLSGKDALRRYDQMAVLMANKYGKGVEGFGCADVEAMIEMAIAAPPSRVALVSLAQRAGMDPSLPAPRCAAGAGH